jgi:hypothetical protein
VELVQLASKPACGGGECENHRSRWRLSLRRVSIAMFENPAVMALSTGGSSGRLLGKCAVVTGAAAGIGRATAELIAREGLVLFSLISTLTACRRYTIRLST